MKAFPSNSVVEYQYYCIHVGLDRKKRLHVVNELIKKGYRSGFYNPQYIAESDRDVIYVSTNLVRHGGGNIDMVHGPIHNTSSIKVVASLKDIPRFN